MMKWLMNGSAALLLIGLGWAMPLQVQAQGTYYYWNVASPNTGTYDDGANWVDSDGTPMGLAPGAGDSAIIKNNGSLLVDTISPIGDDVNYPFQIWVGAGATGPLDPSEGHVVQDGGDVYFEKYLSVGTDSSPGTSTWTIGNYGTINQVGTTGGLYVGDVANGSMTVDYSTITLNNLLRIADGAEGTMTLNSGASVGAKYLEIGKNVNAAGTLSMTGSAGATFNSTSNSYVGSNGGTGSIELHGTASASFGARLFVGSNGGTGSISLSDSASLNVTSSIYMGYRSGSGAAAGYCDLTMSGGQISAANIAVNNDLDGATNDITMTGGSVMLAAGLSVGYTKYGYGLGSTELRMSGNSYISVSEGSLEIAWGGTGSVYLGSGNAAENALISSANVVYLGYGVGATSTYARLDLNAGGTLEAPQIASGCDEGAAAPLSSVVNFNGGTLRATAASADFIANTGGSVEFKTNVQAGGVVIDTNNYDIAINTDLVKDAGSPGGGLTKLGAGTLTLAGVNTYTGDTLVETGMLSAANNTIFADLADLWIASGATVDLNFTGSDTIAGLYLDDVLQAEGTWGATGSGAQHVNDVYFSGTGTLLVGAATLIPGDADENGVVNELDAVNLADNWGATTLNPTYGVWWKMGDFNNDHVVNAADAAILAANWGAHAESSPENGSPVPEPTTLAGLLGMAALLVLGRRCG